MVLLSASVGCFRYSPEAEAPSQKKERRRGRPRKLAARNRRLVPGTASSSPPSFDTPASPQSLSPVLRRQEMTARSRAGNHLAACRAMPELHSRQWAVILYLSWPSLCQLRCDEICSHEKSVASTQCSPSYGIQVVLW